MPARLDLVPLDRPVLWKCKDGRVIYLHEMSDEHLEHTICMARRAWPRSKAWLLRLEAERAVRVADGLLLANTHWWRPLGEPQWFPHDARPRPRFPGDSADIP